MEFPRKLKILVATPFGEGGQGGIDRLNDDIFLEVQTRNDVKLTRLITRGRSNLFVAQFIFTAAIVKFIVLALARQVDVLHIHLSDRGSSYRKSFLGMLSRALRIPYVVHLHGVNFQKSWLGADSWLALLVDRLLLRSKTIIVLGQIWATMITARLPKVTGRVVILPNATRDKPIRHSHETSDVTEISFLGQLGPRKGTGYLIEALSRLADQSKWMATLAGDGDISGNRKKAVDLGLTHKIRFPGWLDSGESDNLLARTDILVLPSFAENLPMAIIEAFAAGVAVVATPVGAIPEVIQNGQNGILVPTGDSEALAGALELLIADPSLRRRLGNNARSDHAKRYEMRSYIAALIDIWRAAAEPPLSN